MSFGPNWEPGWWRHPSHVRKCEKARGDVLRRVSARARRREAMKDFASVFAVLGAAVLVAAAILWILFPPPRARTSPGSRGDAPGYQQR